MSGGSMNYAFIHLNKAEESLRYSIEQERNHPELRKALADHMRQCSKVLHGIEWSDSADTGADDWVAGARELLGWL